MSDHRMQPTLNRRPVCGVSRRAGALLVFVGVLGGTALQVNAATVSVIVQSEREGSITFELRRNGSPMNLASSGLERGGIGYWTRVIWEVPPGPGYSVEVTPVDPRLGPAQSTGAKGVSWWHSGSRSQSLGILTFSGAGNGTPGGTEGRSHFIASQDGKVSLSSAYPNPTRAVSTVHATMPEAGPVSLTVFDVAGRPVRTLVEGELSAGIHSIVWDGRDNGGRSLSAGIYMYQLKVAGKKFTSRVMLAP